MAENDDLQKALAEMPWKAILVPFGLAVLTIALTLVMVLWKD